MKTEDTLMCALMAVCAIVVIGAFVAMLVAGISPGHLAHAAASSLPAATAAVA
ncbi:MAG TPA: hypothetical protein VFG73_04130 [Rhodanobacteraceae bacterium]|nr:hypothetical protein [Rhodanobacteraceae bacterium]